MTKAAPAPLPWSDNKAALAIAKCVADRCQGSRKPGQAPTRYDLIFAGAAMGAHDALKSIEDRTVLGEAIEMLRDVAEGSAAPSDIIGFLARLDGAA